LAGNNDTPRRANSRPIQLEGLRWVHGRRSVMPRRPGQW